MILINFGEFLKKMKKIIFTLDSVNNLQEECSQIVDLNDKAKKIIDLGLAITFIFISSEGRIPKMLKKIEKYFF
jgi:hypothetical protein